MAIELGSANVSHVGYVGNGDFIVPAGKHVRIETSPEGEEHLDIEVPPGKTWRVQINVEITETDA